MRGSSSWWLILASLSLLGVADSSLVSLSRQQKQQLLDAHNELRARVTNGRTEQPKAANMRLMSWDDRLAETAATWVQQCTAGHDSKSDRLISGYSYVGQNWAGMFRTNYSHAVQMWFDEISAYTKQTKSCSAECGHYTQVLWAKSMLIGCAVADCSDAGPFSAAVVCNYATGGNYNGEDVYAEGSPASDCPGDFVFNMGGVCSTRQQCQASGKRCDCTLTADMCQNGATFDRENCQCVCPDGFFGSKCQTACKDQDGWSYTCETKGKNDCSRYKAYCLKSCNACQTRLSDSAAVNSDGIVARVPGAPEEGSPTVPTTTGVGVTTQTTTLPPLTAGVCEDDPEVRCSEWADTCDDNSIRLLCPKTCNSCEILTVCLDLDPKCSKEKCICPTWKSICKPTCGVCTPRPNETLPGKFTTTAPVVTASTTPATVTRIIAKVSDCSDSDEFHCDSVSCDTASFDDRLYCAKKCGTCQKRQLCADYWTHCSSLKSYCTASWGLKTRVMCKRTCDLCS